MAMQSMESYQIRREKESDQRRRGTAAAVWRNGRWNYSMTSTSYSTMTSDQ
jgi:hypothetical protein